MVDLVNNVVALRINSRDRINISDSTTDFTIGLRKSLRNIAAINVAGVVIPRNDTLIGPNNDTLAGEIHIDDIINPFEVAITRTNYTTSSLATELQTQLNANTDMLSYGITFAVSYVPANNRMDIVATYPLGATKTWAIAIDYSSLRDMIGIGVAGTTAQTFTAIAGSITLDITCTRAPNLVRALTYNITSTSLTNAVNTSYISSIGKQFQITPAINQLNIDSKFTVNATDVVIPPPGALFQSLTTTRIGISVSLSNTGTTMVVGSSEYGVYIFNRISVLDPWVLSDSSPLRLTNFIYNDQGRFVALSGDGSIIAFSSIDKTFVYSKSGTSWVLRSVILQPKTPVSLNIDGSTLALSTLLGAGSVLIYARDNTGTWPLQQTLTNPPGSVKFGSSGVSLSNTGDYLVTGDVQFGSVVAYVYLRTAGVWALQQTLAPGDAIGGAINAVAFSGNGLYLAISSSSDNASVGATWIYNWTGATWNEQQKIIVASTSVAMNIAGDTVVIGYSANAGRVNVYKRSGALWSVELANYVGTGGIAGSNQGAAVAITGSGNDIIWGGPGDLGLFTGQGAIWSAHRVVTTWSQTLSKVSSTLGIARPRFGESVAMSDDKNTLAVGIPDDDGQTGAVFVYISNGLEWILQETIIRPAVDFNFAQVGKTVALSADGNTLAMSAHTDVAPGGAFVYVRSGSVWTLQASLSSSLSPILFQSQNMALNGPGNTLVVSGDSTANGLLIWTRSANTWSEKEINLGAGSFGGNAISHIDISNDETTIVASSAGFGAIVYKLIAGTWTQIGANFISFYTPVIATAQFGFYCCISADGQTVAISDPNDNAMKGVVFIFKNVANSWVQNAALTGTDPSPPSNQGYAMLLTNNGNTCLITSPSFTQPFVSASGAVWSFDYNGVSWAQTGFRTVLGFDYGYSISGQRTGLTYAIGAPSLANVFSGLIGKVFVYSAAGTEYSLTSNTVIPSGSFSIFDLVNSLNKLLADAIPTGTGQSYGYSVSFDGTSRLTLTANIGFPIASISFRVSTSSTFNVARWLSQEYKTAQVSNPIVFSINNDVIKSITNHSDNSDNVLVDNTPDTPYRKYPAGYTIDADTPIDIQLRNDRDQIIDLNGSDWVMTVYATVRS